MAEMVTLALPDEIVNRARDTARRTGRGIEEVLSAWIARAAASDTEADAASGSEYRLYTPYGNEATAQTLIEVLRAAEVADEPRAPGA